GEVRSPRVCRRRHVHASEPAHARGHRAALRCARQGAAGRSQGTDPRTAASIAVRHVASGLNSPGPPPFWWRANPGDRRKSMRRFLGWWALFAALTLSGCGYNDFQAKDEQVKAAWSEVLNQYKRRADLIPNLVATVQGYAAQEKDVLLGVTQARAKAGSVQLTPEALNDPQAVKNFAPAQGDPSTPLSPLL